MYESRSNFGVSVGDLSTCNAGTGPRKTYSPVTTIWRSGAEAAVASDLYSITSAGRREEKIQGSERKEKKHQICFLKSWRKSQDVEVMAGMGKRRDAV